MLSAGPSRASSDSTVIHKIGPCSGFEGKAPKEIFCDQTHWITEKSGQHPFKKINSEK